MIIDVMYFEKLKKKITQKLLYFSYKQQVLFKYYKDIQTG